MPDFYRTLDHTADLGIRVRGPDLDALFVKAGLAMTDLLVDIRSLSAKDRMALDVSGMDRTDLLINFLRELLYLWHGHQKLACGLAIKSFAQNRLAARIEYDIFDPRHHEIRSDIKAVTYHQAEIVRVRNAFEVEIIFDV